jgi:hypothetical protein
MIIYSSRQDNSYKTEVKYWAHARITGTILLFAALSATSVLAAPRPNVIVIMADDLGAEGVGCYGSTIYTTTWIEWPNRVRGFRTPTPHRYVRPHGS